MSAAVAAVCDRQAGSPSAGHRAVQGTPSASNAQLRKIKKPLIERRRRERINECLSQLKTLVLEATNKDETRYSKMEKADILEMTVAHLRSIHSSRSSLVDRLSSSPSHAAVAPSAASPSSIQTTDAALRYMAGYSECMREVTTFLSGADVASAAQLPDDVRETLVRHLDGRLRVRVVAVAGCAPHPQPMDCSVARASPDSVLSLSDLRAASPMSDKSSSSSSVCLETSPDVGVDFTVESRRSRCDSGVYSGASSPSQAEDEAAAAWDRHAPRDSMSLTPVAARPTPRPSNFEPLQESSPSSLSDVWRPW